MQGGVSGPRAINALEKSMARWKVEKPTGALAARREKQMVTFRDYLLHNIPHVVDFRR